MSSQAENRQGRTKTESSSSLRAVVANAVIIFYVHQAERFTRRMDDDRTDRQP